VFSRTANPREYLELLRFCAQLRIFANPKLSGTLLSESQQAQSLHQSISTFSYYCFCEDPSIYLEVTQFVKNMRTQIGLIATVALLQTSEAKHTLRRKRTAVLAVDDLVDKPRTQAATDAFGRGLKGSKKAGKEAMANSLDYEDNMDSTDDAKASKKESKKEIDHVQKSSKKGKGGQSEKKTKKAVDKMDSLMDEILNGFSMSFQMSMDDFSMGLFSLSMSMPSEPTPTMRPVAPTVAPVATTPAPVTVPATPAPVAPDTPAPVVPETPAPVAPDTPAPVAPDTPAPVAPDTPAPVAPDTPAPVAPDTPAPVSPTPAPVAPDTPAPVTPGTPVPSLSGCSLKPREEAMEDILVEITDGPILSDPSTPQGMALRWLLDDDPLQIDPCTYATVEQRYALATFYYSTAGDSWIDNEAWLTGAAECDWFGVECSADAVTSIVLGMFV
jgi:hypothetical protein